MAATQETTGATRFRGPTVITLRGAGSLGHDPLTVGAGADVALRLQIPSAQTANAFIIEKPDGTVIAAIDSAGNLQSPALMTATVSISAADIVATGAGKFGHTAGQIIVASPGTGYVLEFVSGVVSFTYATAAYTGGGNVTFNISGGGAALTGLISAGSSFGASSSNITAFYPLSTAGVALTEDTGINLKAASAFTQPGTAAGTAKVFVSYRVHTL